MDKKISDLFGFYGEQQPLDGGQGISVKVDKAVFKPVYNKEVYIASSELWNSLSPTGYRITRHLKSVNGSYVENGFGATEYIEMFDEELPMSKVLEVSKLIHEDLSKIDIKKLPNKIDDPWLMANDILWHGEKFSTDKGDEVEAICKYILSNLKEIDVKCQLIHSDFGGNVALDENRFPVVFDFSPSISPVEYADSIIVCDSIAWGGADMDCLKLLQPYEHYIEYIKNAVAFRVITIACNKERTKEQVFEEWEHFKPIWDNVVNDDNK